MQTIVFVGAGSMAEAIIAGMVKKAVIHPKKLFVMNKGDDKRLFSLQQKYGISIVCEQRDALKSGSRGSCYKTARYSSSDVRHFTLFKSFICGVICHCRYFN